MAAANQKSFLPVLLNFRICFDFLGEVVALYTSKNSSAQRIADQSFAVRCSERSVVFQRMHQFRDSFVAVRKMLQNCAVPAIQIGSRLPARSLLRTPLAQGFQLSWTVEDFKIFVDLSLGCVHRPQSGKMPAG
jgi:hypothetical protein